VYAVIKSGGKQHIVNEGSVIRVEKLTGETGAKIDLSDVLLIGGDGSPKIGAPLVDGAKVSAEITKQAKDKKVLVYKKNRRKGYEKLRGHRQQYTELKVTKISV